MTTQPTADVLARRTSLTQLGAAVRELTHAVVDTEVDDDRVAEAVELARRATELLTGRTRPLTRFSPAENFRPGGPRIFSPVVGPASPVAPPVVVTREDAERLRVEAECTLHRVHEGPPTLGHGGMSAMVLDQLLGQAVMLGGHPGLTRTLEVRYRRPVPLEVPLLLVAAVTLREGSRLEATGTIATAAAPGLVLVEAVGTFVVPTPEQVARIFGDLHPPDADAELPTSD